MENSGIFPHLSTNARWQIRLKRALSKGIMTDKDAELVSSYLLWKVSDNGISDNTQTKIYSNIQAFREKLPCQFSDISETSWQSAIVAIRSCDNRSDWFKTDVISHARGFMFWGIEKGHILNLDRKAVGRVKVPKGPKITKTPDELPTIDELNKLMQHHSCSYQQQAMLAIAYWSGMRIGEILRLNWSDIIFSAKDITLRVKDTKGKQLRAVPCVEPLPYVAVWRRHYPKEAGLPEGDNPVFINRRGLTEPYHRAVYQTTWAWITRLEAAAGTKHFGWHACRAANITNCTMAGVPDSVIKDLHWGNQNTNMMATYTLLTDDMKRNAMLKRAGIEVEEEPELRNIPQNCPSCCALNGPGDQYCRLCGYPLSKTASQKQKMINDAGAYVQQNYTIEEMVESMASVLGITTEKAKQILMGGL